MKSRIGFGPNGTLLFKNPQDHFNEEDFIKAIDKWSQSIKDNPVANFAAKIKIKQIHVFPVYHLMSHRKYENRSVQSHKILGNPNQYNRVPAVNWNQVNAWNYELEEKRDNHEVTLSDTIYSENCTQCHTTGKINIRCTGCSGSGHTVEEEYRNGNTYRVTKSCYSCGGTGEDVKQCPTCEGHGGFINYLSCLVEYLYPSLSQKFAETRVVPLSNDLHWEEKDFNYFGNVKTAAEFVAFVAGDIKETSIGQIIHFINSHDSANQHLIREVTTYGYTYASYVNFDYEEGGEYTVLLYGDQDKVFAPDSPVSNSIDNMLAEANDFLLAKDFKSAGKIISHLSAMKTKNDSIDGFVANFRKKASDIIFTLSNLPKTPDLKKYRLQRESVALGNAALEVKELYSLKTEIFSYFVLPLVILMAGDSNVLFAKNADVTTAAMGLFTKCLIGSALAFAMQFMMSRNSDIFYKSWWKYALHGILAVTPGALFLSQGSSFMGYIGYSIVVGLVMYGMNTLLNKMLGDSANSFHENKSSGYLESFASYFAEELEKIKEHLPGSKFSYIDEAKQSEYRMKARLLEETVNTTSDEHDLNFFKKEDRDAA